MWSLQFARTRRRWAFGLAIAAAAMVSTASIWAQYDPRLQYQLRGDRNEGLRTIPVGGPDIALLSARIDGPADATNPPATGRAWGETVHARFFVPESASLFLAVRQIRSNSTYYWLNHPEPATLEKTWTLGRMNEYPWPTSAVLKNLPNVHLEDLGAVVRVGQPDADKAERVLPVDLTDGATLARPGRYRFAFKTNRPAFVTAVIFRDSTVVYTRPGSPTSTFKNVAGVWEQGGSPITVVWDPSTCTACPEGWYRLVIAGYFQNNTPLDKEVQFFHRLRLTDAAAPR